MPVVLLTLLFCALAAFACWIVPGVRDGTVPAIGGIVWHALGGLEVLVKNVFGRIGARVGEATTPALGFVVQIALTAASALLFSMVIWLPVYLVRARRGPSAAQPSA
jgi:hypothetical protein